MYEINELSYPSNLVLSAKGRYNERYTSWNSLWFSELNSVGGSWIDSDFTLCRFDCECFLSTSHLTFARHVLICLRLRFRSSFLSSSV